MSRLVTTDSHQPLPFETLEEFAENGEPLEVSIPGIENARPVRNAPTLLGRWAEFLPFKAPLTQWSLGEGGTPLWPAGSAVTRYTGIENLLVKNEAQNPTGSFKDRGSVTCIAMANECREQVTATISTGNMGHSIAAYAGRAGLKAIVFVPDFTPREKLLAIAMHGAKVIRVCVPDYSEMKRAVLGMAREFSLRIVSGNGPIRVEGYKLTAFEVYEQLGGEIPDFVAVPTSACGHIRGLFKGFLELKTAGLTASVPRMILVQAANNSPLVTAIKGGLKAFIPFTNFHTVAEAITSGNPAGGNELLAQARAWNWLAESATEDEILESQRRLAAAGFFVEPAAATSLAAVRNLRAAGEIPADARVVLMLTGSGLKDMAVLQHQPCAVQQTDLRGLPGTVERVLEGVGQ